MDLNDGVFVEHSALALFEHETASCPLIGWEGTLTYTHTHTHAPTQSNTHMHTHILSEFHACDF